MHRCRSPQVERLDCAVNRLFDLLTCVVLRCGNSIYLVTVAVNEEECEETNDHEERDTANDTAHNGTNVVGLASGS